MQSRTWSVLAITGGIIIIVGLGLLFIIPAQKQPPATSGTATTTTDYYGDTSTWQTYKDASAGFSVSYPLDFETNEVHNAPSTDWRMNAGDASGSLLFTLTVPKAFQPQTNFSEAKLTVGKSADTKAVADCMTPDPSGSPVSAPKPVSIHGVLFTVFTMSDAGAGNLYDMTSYRTVRAGTCYAVEYTIHSTQLANYPESYHLKAFDEAAVTAVLDRVVNTFSFQ